MNLIKKRVQEHKSEKKMSHLYVLKNHTSKEVSNKLISLRVFALLLLIGVLMIGSQINESMSRHMVASAFIVSCLLILNTAKN